MVCYGLTQTIRFGGEISGKETEQKLKKWTSCKRIGFWLGGFGVFFSSLVKAAGRSLCMMAIPGVGQLFKRDICY